MTECLARSGHSRNHEVSNINVTLNPHEAGVLSPVLASRTSHTRSARPFARFLRGMIGLAPKTLMVESNPLKAEKPMPLSLCVQPDQSDTLRLADRTVATLRRRSASTEPDQIRQSTRANSADPTSVSLPTAESAGATSRASFILDGMLRTRFLVRQL